MGVSLVRSLQPPDILWIYWSIYNFIADTNKWVLFLSPSDDYVRSFLYLLYALIKLYYTNALSDQASSLAPDWILLLQGPRIPASWFNNKLSIRCCQQCEEILSSTVGESTNFHFFQDFRQLISNILKIYTFTKHITF